MTEHVPDPAHHVPGRNGTRGPNGTSGSIVVGIDGSCAATRGLLFAAGLAVELHAELVVVHAYGLADAFVDWRTDAETYERRLDETMANEWCAPLAENGELVWQWRCVRGSGVDAVLRTADDVDALFIVVGTHGAGSTSAPLLGRTSHRIVRDSRRAVIVVPPGDEHVHRRIGARAMPQISPGAERPTRGVPLAGAARMR